MKANISIFLSVMASLFVLVACDKKELEDYSGPDSIYFDYQWSTKSISFLAQANNEIDTSFTVFTLGEVANRDRVFRLVVDEASTLVRGTHFEVDLEFKMPAGKAQVEVPVRVLRHPDMQQADKEFVIVLRLVETEDFNTNLKDVSEIDVRKCWLKVTDGIRRPTGWTDVTSKNYFKYYGKYSLKKYMVLMEVCQKPADFFSNIYDPETFGATSRLVKIYLEKQNPKILDEDGTEMKMGDSAPW